MTLISPVFIVGAQRCGTTYMCHVLKQHPQVWLAEPLRPEPKFFLQPHEVAKGLEHYLKKHFGHAAVTGDFSNLQNIETDPIEIGSAAPDASSTARQNQVLLEKSTSYIESREAALRIKAMFPSARIIISLRDPVARAMSNYLFSVSSGMETRSPSEVFLDRLPEPHLSVVTSVSPFNYLARGEYARYVRSYLDIFGKGAVRVILFDRFVESVPAMQEVFKWLGIDAGFVAVDLQTKVNRNNVDLSAVDDRILEYLQDYYRSHVQDLEQLLDVEIPEWTSASVHRAPIVRAGIETTTAEVVSSKNSPRNHSG